MPFRFWKPLFIIICLSAILGTVLYFAEINTVKKTEAINYPLKSSILESLLADISQVFENKKIEVDLSQQKMRLFEGNEVVAEFLISSGKKEKSTPVGNYKVYKKFIMVYSKSARCWLPFWVGFTKSGIYGFHEVPVCKEGREGVKELGTPASAGCIRLGVGDSETFYKWVQIGTSIIIK